MPTSGLGSKHKNAFLTKLVERNVELERISREQEETIQSLRNEIQVLQISNVNIVDQNKAIENEELKQRLLTQSNDLNLVKAELYKVRNVEQSLSVALKDKQHELKNVQNQMFYLLKILQSLDLTNLNSMEAGNVDYKSFVELCTLLKAASIKDEEILNFSMSGTIVGSGDLHMLKQLNMYVSKLRESNAVLAKETQQILKRFLPNVQSTELLEKFSSILAVVYSGHINIGCLYNKIVNIISIISIPASINNSHPNTQAMPHNPQTVSGPSVDPQMATSLPNEKTHGHFGSVPNMKINTFNIEPLPFLAQGPPISQIDPNEGLNHSKSVPVKLNEAIFLNEDAAGAPIHAMNNLDLTAVDPPSGPIIDLSSTTTTDTLSQQSSSFSAPANSNEILNPYMDAFNISNRYASNPTTNAFNESNIWR